MAKRKNERGAGRKAQGRVPVLVHLLPAARALLDASKTAKGDTRGKVIERLLGVRDPKGTPKKTA